MSCRMGCAGLKLLLLWCFVVVLPGSVQLWSNYGDLPEEYRTHIDKALDEANDKLGGHHHIVFESLLSEPTISLTRWHVNVRLMITECEKDRTKRHRAECDKQKPKTPWIDCLVCKNDRNAELIDCARQVDVMNGREIRKQYLYRAGAGSILSQKSGNVGAMSGCIGCV